MGTTGGSSGWVRKEKHYIEWVEVITGGKACRQFLKPGEAPEAEFAEFEVRPDPGGVHAYRNLHGLWMG